jgi:hypothetical protein
MEQLTEVRAVGESDGEFCNSMLSLRNMAARIIEKRATELFRWDVSERNRVERWFGLADEEMRTHLRTGLTNCRFVLLELTCANFVRYVPGWGPNVGCRPANGNAVAQVCPTDTGHHLIAITEAFFELLEMSPSKDSQVSTLIHEVTHFRDTFSSEDLRYGLNASRRYNSVPQLARINADNIAGYVVEGMIYGD